jgi:hypothetical protein
VFGIRLIVPDRDQLPPGAVERAYMTGMDGVPWRSHCRWVGDHLVLEREVKDSGYLFICLRVPGHRDLVLSTATLMVRERPYHLPVEIARGTLNRLRNQRAAWDLAGLAVPADLDERIHAATQALVQATTSQSDQLAGAQAAGQCLRLSLEAMDRLGQEYTEQALAIRHGNSGKLSTFFAGNLGPMIPSDDGTSALAAAFNTAVVPMRWSDVEPNAGSQDWRQSDAQIQWCRGNNLKICIGPLLKLDRLSLPNWLFLWEDDFAQVQRHIQQHLQTVVERYKGKAHVWHAVSGTNVPDTLELGEEQRLRLTVSAIETVRRIDSKTPIILSIDQPWAEYMSREPLDLAPLHFADALVRADLGLAGIGLEINVGCWPGGTLPRDILEFSLQIDRWGMLGMPLVVMLTVPSSSADDPQAGLSVDVLDDGTSAGLAPQSQRSFVEEVVPLLLAKPSVQGIIWNQLHDGQPHAFPHGGLLDAQGRAKPALQALTDIRREHLA